MRLRGLVLSWKARALQMQQARRQTSEQHHWCLLTGQVIHWLQLYLCKSNDPKQRCADAKFERSIFNQVNLTHATGTNMKFSECQLETSVFDQAKIDQSTFEGSNMNSVSMVGAEFSNTSFAQASLKGADLRGARLVGCDMTGAAAS